MSFNTKILIALASCLLCVGIATAVLTPHGMNSDGAEYLQAMTVVHTNVVPDNFRANRILSSSWPVMFLSNFNNSLPLWIGLNIALFVFAGVMFYLLLLKLFGTHERAPVLIGTGFLVLNYAMIVMGINYLMDVGGWSFYIASLYFSLRYVETKNLMFVLLASMMVGWGLLFKEYAGLGFIVIAGLIFYTSWNDKKNLASKLFWASLISFSSLFVVWVWVYLTYHYSYLDWFSFNHTTFKDAYSSRIVEYIKSFGSLFNFGWFLFLGGVYALIRERRSITTDMKRYLSLVGLSALPVFVWPAITQRIEFIVIPFVVIMATYFICQFRRMWPFLLILAIYTVCTYSMDKYILPNVNIDGIFHTLHL